MIPAHRMELPVGTAGITVFINGYQEMQVIPYPFKIIQLIKPFPYFRQVCSCDIGSVYNIKNSLLLLWMTFKICTVKFADPGPVIFSIGSRMQPHISTSPSDELF